VCVGFFHCLYRPTGFVIKKERFVSWELGKRGPLPQGFHPEGALLHLLLSHRCNEGRWGGVGQAGAPTATADDTKQLRENGTGQVSDTKRTQIT